MASIFTKIILREIPSEIVYEQDDIIVIRDVNPQAKTHLLIIPKKEIATLNDMVDDDNALMSELFDVAKKVAKQLGVEQGYSLRLNVGEKGGQEVFHIHMHLLSDI